MAGSHTSAESLVKILEHLIIRPYRANYLHNWSAEQPPSTNRQNQCSNLDLTNRHQRIMAPLRRQYQSSQQLFQAQKSKNERSQVKKY
jgi:hypothetical protein